MLVRLTPNQIPSMWEAIKYAAVKSGRLNKDEMPRYLNKLLNDLLSGNAQCFVKLNEKRILSGIILSKLIEDNLTNDKSLLIENLYSFEPVTQESWLEGLDIIGKFAVANECITITTYADSEKVYEILKMMGFRERYRCFITEVI